MHDEMIEDIIMWNKIQQGVWEWVCVCIKIEDPREEGMEELLGMNCTKLCYLCGNMPQWIIHINYNELIKITIAIIEGRSTE